MLTSGRVLMRGMLSMGSMRAAMVFHSRHGGSGGLARMMFMTLHGIAFFASVMIALAVLAMLAVIHFLISTFYPKRIG
jgi:hypothetical protein